MAAYSARRSLGYVDTAYIPVSYDLHELDSDLVMDEITEYYNEHYSMTGHKEHISDNNIKDSLYILDYCLPVNTIKYLSRFFKEIVVLDHHETSLKEYSSKYSCIIGLHGWREFNVESNCTLYFSDSESGAKMSWMYFSPNTEIPEVIELVSDRDLWKFDLKHSRSFNYGSGLFGLRSCKSFDELDRILEVGTDNIVLLGQLYQNSYNDKINTVSKEAISITVIIDGKEFSGSCMINSDLSMASDLCNKLIKEDGYDIAIAYVIENDKVRFSVRSSTRVDSSVISKHFGGGGHKQASGFSSTLDHLYSVLSSKVLEV